MHLGNQMCSPYPVAGVLEAVQNCESVCEHMQHYVAGLPDAQARGMQMRLLHDCADICGLTAKFIARNSMFAREIAGLCAIICEACGCECARFPDRMSQHCAQVCLHCAAVCRAFAGMLG